MEWSKPKMSCPYIQQLTERQTMVSSEHTQRSIKSAVFSVNTMPQRLKPV